jgi:rubrerythrin
MQSHVEQLETIGLMAAHEEAIAQLYLACAQSFPHLADVFNGLAETEREHARSITSFAAKVRAGSARLQPDRLHPHEILTSLDHVNDLRSRIAQGAASLEDALAECTEVEETLLEKHCFDIIESDAPDLKELLQKLSDDTAEHREELRRAREQQTG